MTSISHLFSGLRARLSRRRAPLRRHAAHPDAVRAGSLLPAAAAVLAFALVALGSVAPFTTTSAQERLRAEIDAHSQHFTVAETVIERTLDRDDYSITPGITTWVRGGTNHDWARLVLLLGGWPLSDNNVTVLTRWMRQENGPNNWWNRNNPLNNGWGSGGGGGTGSYPDLQTAARYVGIALHSLAGYAPIVAALARSAPTEVTEQAIWASPWASGHYANGGHWHYTPVPEVKAPVAAWG